MIITRAIIVDDDDSAIDLLQLVISQDFPAIKIIATCHSVNEAINAIESEKPDLVFLDIELPDGYGFDLLNKDKYHNFEVIFITAFNEYAVRAFEFAALHYLLKPITNEKLFEAIERYKYHNHFESFNQRLNVLKENFIDKPKKIMLSTGNGLEIFDLDDIVRFEADNNYTNIYFKMGNYIIVSKNLQNFETALSEDDFIRVHRKFIVNIEYIKKIIRKKQPYIILDDGFEIPISESKYDIFKEKILQYARIV